MIEEGILKQFDSIEHRASVQLLGSLTTYFDGVKVARNIESTDMVPGRRVFVVIPENAPGSAVVIAVFDP